MKRILFVNPKQFGYSAGHHYYCQYLKDSYNIDYLCHDMGMIKVDMPGVNIIYFSYRRSKILRLFLFIYKAIFYTYKNKYDIIFITYFKFVFLIGLLSRCKISILDIRTGALNKNIIKRRILNNIISLNTIPFNKVIVVSEGLKNIFSLPMRKASVIPLGAPKFSSSKKSFEKIHLLYVGSLYKRNIGDTIQGLQRFYKEYGDKIEIRYDIVGFGKKEEEKIIFNLITYYNLKKVVRFHGKKNHSELVDLFENANIGVCYVPIKDYFQVQPATKLFEYALSGMFIIATNTKENRKYINSENGILCEDNPESFFESLVKIYNIRSSIDSEKIRTSLKEYNWENIVQNKLKPLLDDN